MKALLLSTALAAGFAWPALAQSAPASPFQSEAAGPSVSASDVIGARIYVSEAAVDADAYSGVQEGWDDVGEVNDIILGRDGTVDAVLVDIGGFLGIGERQVAVDMSALKIVQDDATDADDWFLVLQADRATLDGAPAYSMPGAEAMDDQAAADNGGMEDVPVVNEATGDTAEAAPEAEATMDTADATPMQDGAMALPEGYTAVQRDALTAEMLTGANVRDTTDTSIAEVADLVLTADGQVTDVVVDVGGFLGIGAKSVAIPMDRLTVAQADGGVVSLWVDMTKEELEALPEHQL
ncbi:MAG: PRC-barrel domain containing protein [Tabrizicola sp.]|nr:PRC-barrel domain containing protein [Tabrizicola sp.]